MQVSAPLSALAGEGDGFRELCFRGTEPLLALTEGSAVCGTDGAVNLVGFEDLVILLDDLGVELLETCDEELVKFSPEVSFLTSARFLGFLKLE